MVVQETELSRSKLYVIYLHRAASDTTVPIASGATLSTGAPAAATPDWEMWDSMFLPTIHSLSPLFDQSYNKPFKVYLAVHLVMAVADKITSDKKALTMGADGQLPGILDWLSARVGIHGIGVRTVPYMVYGHTTTISISHGTIRIPYREDHSLELSVSVQVWYGHRQPFTTIYYSVK